MKTLVKAALLLLVCAAMPAFAQDELSLTVQFEPATLLESGQPLTDLSGYRLYYSVDAPVTESSPYQVITLDQVLSETIINFDVELTPKLTPYTLEFSITAVRENGVMGNLSQPTQFQVLVEDLTQPLVITGFSASLSCNIPGCTVTAI